MKKQNPRRRRQSLHPSLQRWGQLPHAPAQLRTHARTQARTTRTRNETETNFPIGISWPSFPPISNTCVYIHMLPMDCRLTAHGLPIDWIVCANAMCRHRGARGGEGGRIDWGGDTSGYYSKPQHTRHRFGQQSGLDESSGQNSTTHLHGIVFSVYLVFSRINAITKYYQTTWFSTNIDPL